MARYLPSTGRSLRVVVLVALGLGLALGLVADGALADGSRAVRGPKAALRPIAKRAADDPLLDPVSPQGQQARGLYFSAPAYNRLGAKGVIKKLRQAGLDAAVIDMKDGEGRVSYDTQIPALQPQKERFVEDVPAFVAELKAGGIYTIARVVCFSDPFLPKNEPDRAVMDGRPYKQGQIWANWGKRNTWLDTYNPKNHQLIADIAREVEALGFDEIQLDYIRFPVDEATKFAHWPSQVDKPRRKVLVDILRGVDEAIRIPISADVFGLTALRRGDPAGLGQSLEDWTPYVEIFSPMLYINGMHSFLPPGAQQRAGRLIYLAVKTLRDRVGPVPVIRPFMQAFAAGADYYNPEFIAEQVRGARAAGGDGFLFWHPGSAYAMVHAGMVGPAKGLQPFPLGVRRKPREALWAHAVEAAAEGEEVADAADAADAPLDAPLPVTDEAAAVLPAGRAPAPAAN